MREREKESEGGGGRLFFPSVLFFVVASGGSSHGRTSSVVSVWVRAATTSRPFSLSSLSAGADTGASRDVTPPSEQAVERRARRCVCVRVCVSVGRREVRGAERGSRGWFVHY